MDMSSFDKKESRKSEARTESEQTKQESPVSFHAWFTMTLASHKKLQPHHMDTVLAFFKNHGLTESETISQYEKGLKKFGY